MSSLGKRKARDEESNPPQTHGSTLFVSNIPYTVTSTDLQTLFSEIAPVRSAFVVLDHDSGISKGVGYVAFALREDAEVAFKKLSMEGIPLAGRNLRVQWAENKPKDPKDGEEIVKKVAKPRPEPRTTHPRTIRDPLAIRTIIVSGLPVTIEKNSLWKKMRKYPGAESVELQPKDGGADESPSTAHVLFATPAAAQEAINKLHAHVYKGCLLSVTLKKRLETLAKQSHAKPNTLNSAGEAQSADSSNAHLQSKNLAPAPSHSSKLIIRNIPFSATEQDLRALFLPYGPIHLITIPTLDHPRSELDTKDSPKKALSVRRKGFAIIWMLSRKDAERAIEGCNGKVMRAGMADGLVSDKQKRKKQRRLEKKMKAMADGEKQDDMDADSDEEGGVDAKKIVERIIAVDWALSKDLWEKEKSKMAEAHREEHVDAEMAEASDSEDSASDDGHLGVNDGSDASGSDEESTSEIDGERGDEEETPTKPQLPPPEAGTTLFVRNVPFNSTEDEFRILFRAFGPLRYARITKDVATGRSRGTGFACFWNKEDADKVIEQSELLRLETGGEVPLKKNPFTHPSILTPDPSSSLAQSLVLQGRTLDVIRAVTRDEAGKLKEDGEKQRQKADKRNMYLLREGVILPNTPGAERLTTVEVEKRTSSFNARRAVLRSNPSLYISKTRLSVRQIPLFVSDRVLKRLAIHAVRAFEKEVKKGGRDGLTEDELAQPEPEEAESTVPKDYAEGDEKGKQQSRKSSGRPTVVKQAKIVRQQDRIDPVTGKGRSKGYGFVELHQHADALRVLRWANNNPQVGALFEEWWKAELEDLLKREKLKEKKEEARIKRLQDEIRTGGTRKTKSALIVEFSIENVQVVHRRSALQRERANKSDDTNVPEKIKFKAKPQTEERPTKRQRPSKEATEKVSVKPDSERPGREYGSLIGRKRKERKAGKKR